MYFSIDADPNDLVFVPNATTGINTVVQSVIKTFQPGASILTLNLAYGSSIIRYMSHAGISFVYLLCLGATKKLLKHLAVEYKIRVDEVEITFPLQSAEEVSCKTIVSLLRVCVLL